MAPSEARVWVLHAFDVARSISLAGCRRALTTREVAAPRRPEWPHLFGLDERPLVWHPEPVEVQLGGSRIEFQPRVIIYDFGNISVALGCRLPGPPTAWRDAAVDLRNAAELQALARRVLDDVLGRVGDALVGGQVSDETAQYTVFQIDSVQAETAIEWLRANSLIVAQTLRGEPSLLSEEEIAEALARRLSYSAGDVVVIDGAAALVVDREFEDTLAVLDFANCERLSMVVLDDELDRAVADASVLVRQLARRFRVWRDPWGHELTRLTRLTFDAAAEFEAAENAIKLTGDHYLARIYRIALERLDLRPFRESIARKLSSLWSIQGVFLDQAAARRSQLLEGIIIALIAFEILHTFL